MPVGNKNPIIAGSGFHHVAIQARDWEASLKLYRDDLGMPIVAEFGSPERRIVLLDMGDGCYVELFQPTSDTPPSDSPAPNDPVTHFAMTTTDIADTIEHVRAAGYNVTLEPTRLNLGDLDVTIAFFDGPNGESIEFLQVN